MKLRITPSFVVAVMALVVASGGVGFAAGKVTSAQVKDNTIQSRDVRNGSLTGADVRNNGLTGADLANASVPRAKLAPACRGTEIRVSGGCVSRTPLERAPYDTAVTTCAARNGRLPTVGELFWLQTQAGFVFGDDEFGGEYEFTSDWTAARDQPFTPMAVERGSVSNPVPNASAQFFAFHCVTS